MHNLDIILVCMFIFLIDIFSKVFQKNSQCNVSELSGKEEEKEEVGKCTETCYICSDKSHIKPF